MTTWILIILLVGPNQRTITATFHSASACYQALSAINQDVSVGQSWCLEDK